MPSLLEYVKNFFLYQDKPDESRFELLEKPDEKLTHESMETEEFKSVKKIHVKSEHLPEEMSDNLADNLDLIRKQMHASINKDVIITEFNIANKQKAALVMIDGMVDKTVINNFVLRPLMQPNSLDHYQEGPYTDYIRHNIITVHDISSLKEYEKIIGQVLNGKTALLIDESSDCLMIESRGYEKRGVDKPITENVVRGPQEAFSENMRTNITLIRRIIRNKDLITEMFPIGSQNNSECALLYMKNLADPELIKEVKKRIQSVSYDYVNGSGMLEQLINDKPTFLEPQVLSTERPDRVASFLVQGQVAIIADGSPFPLVVPATFFGIFQTSEEAHMNWTWATALRIIRLIALFAAALLPGLYVALTLFHKEMIPTDLLSEIVKSRDLVPFPTVVELLLMEISFELIREAGERVPGVFGPTIGIIGALILGQAAVAADIVSPIMIIVVAVAGLGNFGIPNYTVAASFRMLRFFFIATGAVAGFYGIAISIVIAGVMTCNLKSFGVPYFSPIAPRMKSSRDIILRYPFWMQHRRPDFTNSKNKSKSAPNSTWYTKGKGES